MESSLKTDACISVFSQEDLIKGLQEDHVTINICDNFSVDQRIVVNTKELVIHGQNYSLEFQESGSLYFQDTNAISISDLSISGQGSDWENNLDLLTFDHVEMIHLSGCFFSDGADECVCFKNGCDEIFLTDCTFTYTKPPKSLRERKNHNFALLIGKNANDKPASGKHHVYLDNVSFIGNIRRCPRVRNAYVFMRKCTFNTTSLYTVGPENSELIFVDCKFVNRDIKHPQFIHKFGDYKCIVVENDLVVYKNPKFSQFNKPEFYENYSDSRIW